MAFIIRRGKKEYVGESFGEFKSRLKAKRIAERLRAKGVSAQEVSGQIITVSKPDTFNIVDPETRKIIKKNVTKADIAKLRAKEIRRVEQAEREYQRALLSQPSRQRRVYTQIPSARMQRIYSDRGFQSAGIGFVEERIAPKPRVVVPKLYSPAQALKFVETRGYTQANLERARRVLRKKRVVGETEESLAKKFYVGDVTKKKRQKEALRKIELIEYKQKRFAEPQDKFLRKQIFRDKTYPSKLGYEVARKLNPVTFGVDVGAGYQKAKLKQKSGLADYTKILKYKGQKELALKAYPRIKRFGVAEKNIYDRLGAKAYAKRIGRIASRPDVASDLVILALSIGAGKIAFRGSKKLARVINAKVPRVSSVGGSVKKVITLDKMLSQGKFSGRVSSFPLKKWGKTGRANPRSKINKAFKREATRLGISNVGYNSKKAFRIAKKEARRAYNLKKSIKNIEIKQNNIGNVKSFSSLFNLGSTVQSKKIGRRISRYSRPLSKVQQRKGFVSKKTASEYKKFGQQEFKTKLMQDVRELGFEKVTFFKSALKGKKRVTGGDIFVKGQELGKKGVRQAKPTIFDYGLKSSKVKTYKDLQKEASVLGGEAFNKKYNVKTFDKGGGQILKTVNKKETKRLALREAKLKIRAQKERSLGIRKTEQILKQHEKRKARLFKKYGIEFDFTPINKLTVQDKRLKSIYAQTSKKVSNFISADNKLKVVKKFNLSGKDKVLVNNLERRVVSRSGDLKDSIRINKKLNNLISKYGSKKSFNKLTDLHFKGLTKKERISALQRAKRLLKISKENRQKYISSLTPSKRKEFLRLEKVRKKLAKDVGSGRITFFKPDSLNVSSPKFRFVYDDISDTYSRSFSNFRELFKEGVGNNLVVRPSYSVSKIGGKSLPTKFFRGERRIVFVPFTSKNIFGQYPSIKKMVVSSISSLFPIGGERFKGISASILRSDLKSNFRLGFKELNLPSFARVPYYKQDVRYAQDVRPISDVIPISVVKSVSKVSSVRKVRKRFVRPISDVVSVKKVGERRPVVFRNKRVKKLPVKKFKFPKPFLLPDLKKKKRKIIKKIKRILARIPKVYRPSFSAILLGIYSTKEPSRITGVEIRPIIMRLVRKKKARLLRLRKKRFKKHFRRKR